MPPAKNLQGIADRLSKATQDLSVFDNVTGGAGAARAQQKRVDRLTGRFERRGGELDASGRPTGVDFNPVDFSEGVFSEADAGQSLSRLNQIRQNQGRGQNSVRPSVFNTRVQRANFERKRDETTERVQSELIDKAVINAENEANRIGTFIGNVRTTAENNLRVTAAALGLQGLDPRSPAGAALASATAQRAENDLARGLAELGFQIDTTNAQGRREGVMFLQNALNLDSKFIADSTNELSGILEAVRTRNELAELYADINRDAQPSGFDTNLARVQSGINIFSSAADIFKPGKSGGGQPARPVGSGGGQNPVIP